MQPDRPLKFKPPPTEATKEAVAALKAELEMELQNIKQCGYKPYECTQLTLEGSSYCLRHILQDKNAPYKQCAYVYNSNGKRCHLPALRDKKDVGYCNEHALKTHLATSKRNNRCQPPRTAEVLLHSVSHYIRKPRIRTLSASTQHSDEGRSSPEENNDGLITKSLDPFVEVDSNAVLASGSEVLDMCSDSESDVDATSYLSVWQDAHADSSDNESIDSEQEDVLKHANIYSAEEVTLITRDKLIRLQSLYIDEFRYLTHMLRERRRQYLYGLKREKETCCSVYNQLHDNPKEQRMYKKLKAYNSYHKKHGIEAVCHKRLHERRLKATEGVNMKPPSYSKCIFTEGGVKCGERALPVTRHCRKHILEDPNQILFRACSKMGGDIECTTPVEAIFDDATCRLHMDMPPLRSYSQLRKDSESDYDDSLEAHGPSTSSAHIPAIKLEKFENQIKLELMDICNSTSTMPVIKEEVLENQNPVDVEMPLINTEESKQVTSNNTLLNEADICIGFPSPKSFLDHSKNIDLLSSQTNPTITDNLDVKVTSELPPDSILASQPSTESIISSQSPTDDAIISSELPEDSIISSQLPADSIIPPELPTDSIITSQLPAGSIVASELPTTEKMDVAEETSATQDPVVPSEVSNMEDSNVSLKILPENELMVPAAESTSTAVALMKENPLIEIELQISKSEREKPDNVEGKE